MRGAGKSGFARRNKQISAFVQRGGGKAVKLAPRLVNVRKRQRAMRAIGQQNENALRVRFEPQTRAGETQVSETVFRQSVGSRRIFGRGEFKRERARFV